MAEARARHGRAARLGAAAVLLPLFAAAQTADEAARPPDRPAGIASEPGATTPPPRPEAQGALIPPEEMARRLAEPEAAAGEDAAREATVPSGPPAHSLLRETDFDFAACRLALTLMGADYDVAPPLRDPGDRDCGIDRPLRVRAILPGVELAGAPLMRCDTARALGFWLRDFVRPAAARLPGAPRIAALEPGSTYACRARVGDGSERLSEHALGNAFDVAGFVLNDGTRIPVEPAPADSLHGAFLTAVRGAACMDFATVLGPGSDAAHDDHLHLDIRAREGGYRICQ